MTRNHLGKKGLVCLIVLLITECSRVGTEEAIEQHYLLLLTVGLCLKLVIIVKKKLLPIVLCLLNMSQIHCSGPRS